MSVRKLVEDYYAHIDAGRLAEAAASMAEDVKLTFANAEPVSGRDAATAAVAFVLDQCTEIQHKVVHWIEPHPASDGTTEVLFEIRIHYWLKNGKEVDIPGAVYAAVNSDNEFAEQRLYGDLTEVFAA